MNLYEEPPELDEVNPWRLDPPLLPGTYEFCCNETDFEVETVIVEDRDGILWARMDSIWDHLDAWHGGLTEPAWRDVQ